MIANLSPDDRAFLLQLARRSIEAHLRNLTSHESVPPSAVLQEKRGAFVTIEKRVQGFDQWDLRGCIGHLEADRALYEVVRRVAVEAASGDPRFPPVQLDELPLIRIEISVLSPFKKVQSPSEIEIGRHGLVVSRGGRRGLLLPQVAQREGWDVETFLRYTCLKAGLSSDDWKDSDVAIHSFSADVFHEELR
jgi:AmmeMemoRadiSam system protein A